MGANNTSILFETQERSNEIIWQWEQPQNPNYNLCDCKSVKIITKSAQNFLLLLRGSINDEDDLVRYMRTQIAQFVLSAYTTYHIWRVI